MSWFDRALSGLTGATNRGLPLSMDDWASSFNFNGLSYPFINNALGGSLTPTTEEISSGFAGLAQGGYRGNGIVFACMSVRMRLFSEARFQFQRMRNGTPGDLFGTEALKPLETPWTNATTGTLLTRAIQDVDLAGNFFAWRPGRQPVGFPGGVIKGKGGKNEIHRLRPDWVTIVLGTNMDGFEEIPWHAPDVKVAGYIFHPGGYGGEGEPILLDAASVAHWNGLNPDPLANFRGMSWLTPILRDVEADGAATTHKLKYLQQGATANTVVIAQPAIKNPDAFDVWKAKMQSSLEGLRNLYKTLYLANGADAKVIGSDMRQIDFKAITGAGETRVAAAAGVPPIIVGLSEGLAASTYSNYAQARRALADGTMRPLWRDFAAAMQTVIDVPADDKKTGAARLWYDDRNIPFLAEDVADEANVQTTNANTIHTLVIGGFTPESAVQAVMSNDFSLLEHSGMYSVQLTPAGTVGEGKGAVVGGVPVESNASPPINVIGLLWRKLAEAEKVGDTKAAELYRSLIEELTVGAPPNVPSRPVEMEQIETRSRVEDPAGRALAALLKTL